MYIAKQKQIHRHRKQTCGYGRGEGEERNKLAIWEKNLEKNRYMYMYN